MISEVGVVSVSVTSVSDLYSSSSGPALAHAEDVMSSDDRDARLLVVIE